MAVYIGTSGWDYNHWQDVLYPDGMLGVDRLTQYARHFNSIEVSDSYHRWPRDEIFVKCHPLLPPDLQFTLMAPRALTHQNRLKDPGDWVRKMAGGIQILGSHMGALLVQLPSQFQRDMQRLESFLEAMPKYIRVALEFNNPSWHTDDVFDLLERQGAAYCIMSGANLPSILRTTAPFVYIRFYGPSREQQPGALYSGAELQWWARHILDCQKMGHDVYAYFNNDSHGNAVRNALTLRRLLDPAAAVREETISFLEPLR